MHELDIKWMAKSSMLLSLLF